MQQSQDRVEKRSDHSLMPDIITGWKGHQISKLKQFPLIFSNPRVDQLSKTLTAFGSQQPYRIVYMGPRHSSNMKAFKSYAWADSEDGSKGIATEGEVYCEEKLKRFQFAHYGEKQKFFPIRASEYRLFNGMNPTFKSGQLRFESNFQSGNLDLAISVGNSEYDLAMRVDSNTKGHTAWFFFKVSNFNPGQRVKFNIINFQKSGLLYKEGMGVSVFCSSQKAWKQEGAKLQFRKRKLRYTQDEMLPPLSCLSFQYEFKKQDKHVYFSYGTPYSYSYLLTTLTALKGSFPHLISLSLSTESTGGLPIPLLTITNPTSSEGKLVCLCTARLHPGETQGSWMIDGFIKHLLTPQGYYLRQKVIFKIIPMVNVDGVVLGNFRTGISGRDLNRMFSQPQSFPEINLIRSIALEDKPFIFLDFHGHSAKKNVFVYGPDYAIDSPFYLPSRLLPKIISKKTAAFRYYACMFKINSCKQNTGRAIMLRDHGVNFSFTVEASAFSYGPRGANIKFDKTEYSNVGGSIADALGEFIKIMISLPKRMMQKKQEQINENEQERSSKIKKKKGKKHSKDDKIDKGAHDPKENDETRHHNLSAVNPIYSLEDISYLSEDEAGLIREILESQKGQSKEEDIENEAESDSDAEDPSNDYTEKQLQKIISQKGNEIKIGKTDKSDKNRKIHEKRVNNNKSLTEKNVKIAEDSPQIRELNHHKAIKKLQFNFQQASSKLLGRESIEKNQSQEQDSQMNQLHYKNWRKPQFRSYQLNRSLEKSSSLINPIMLNYQSIAPAQYQPIARHRRKSYKDTSLLRRDRSSQVSKIIFMAANPKLEPIYSVKKLALPLLGRNGNCSNEQESSLLSNILEQHQRSKNTKQKRNLKILYY